MNVIVVKHRKMMMVAQEEEAAAAVEVVVVEAAGEAVEDTEIETEEEGVVAEAMVAEVVQWEVTVTVIVVVAKDLIKCHHNLDLITKLNSSLCNPPLLYNTDTKNKCPFSIKNKQKSNEIDFRHWDSKLIYIHNKNVFFLIFLH